MKSKQTHPLFAIWFVLAILLTTLAWPAVSALAQTITPQDRPIIVLSSFNYSPDVVTAGAPFDLVVVLHNQGRATAFNLVLSFDTQDFLPQASGGVSAIQELDAGEARSIETQFLASSELFGQRVATTTLEVRYNDAQGNQYTEIFTITVNIKPPVYSAPTATPTPTPTPGPTLRAQMVITGYETDVEPLTPGQRFALTIQALNLGDGPARRVSMIVGGGQVNTDPNNPTGGVSGASGELTNFAPLGTSNVQVVGDMEPGANATVTQELIVNVSTNPGAYPLKISFVYVDSAGKQFIDDQVITLLVFSIPSIDLSFYRDPGVFFVGQPMILPIQAVNLGRNTVVLGNLNVTASNGSLSNNTILIGTLEAGGFFTLDASYFPEAPGTTELTLTVDYSDDFNQPQRITKVIPIEVLDAPIIEPPIDGENGGVIDGGEIPTGEPEAWYQTLWRFILGLFGLDSGQPTPAAPVDGFPVEGFPVEGGNFVPVP